MILKTSRFMVFFLSALIGIAGTVLSAGLDFEPDQDVDGADLFAFASGYSAGDYTQDDLGRFSGLFGRTGITVGRTYYIDFENGRDTTDGLSRQTPWQHAPGDPAAGGNPAKVLLQPGDCLLFKSDVIYRGQIRIPAAGSAQMPITYKGDGWPGLPGRRAVIDGGDVVSGWQPCPSALECGGNPNFEHIFYADIPEGNSPLSLNLHELDPATGKDDFLWLAQEPNPSDPYFMDNRFEFISVPQARLTRFSITDGDFFTQAEPEHWRGSFLMIWVNPNIVIIREILSFDPTSHTVYFADLGTNALYPDGRDQAYAVYNSLHALDRAGEYVVGPASNNMRRIYLWPMDETGLAARVTRSVRQFGLDIQGHDYITIQGFEVRKLTGENIRQGVAIGTLSAAHEQNIGLVIKNNLITHNAFSGTGATRTGYGGIYLQNVVDSRIMGNQVMSNPRTKGIFLANAQNTFVENNVIVRPGGTALTLYTGHDCRLIGNTISGSNGSHANGITLYMGCRNILTANNTVLDSGSPVTFEDSGNLFFINNIFDGHNADNNVNEWGDTSHGPWERGTIAFFHNVMVRNARNSALNIGTIPGENTYIVKNNIFDGGASVPGIDRSHNLYTGLRWNQQERYGWQLEDGETVNENLSQIFVDGEHLDFHLLPASPAIGAGTDITALLPVALFPEFDFSLDMEGRPRRQWDLGAYAHE